MDPVVVLGGENGPGEITGSTTIIPRKLGESFTNFPNPFAAGREITTFAFFLPQRSDVSLRIYSGFGRLIRTLEQDRPRGGGRVHDDITWDGTDEDGAVLQNGTYFAVISVEHDNGAVEEAVRKVAVLR